MEAFRRFLKEILENERSKAFLLYQISSFSLFVSSIILGLYDELRGFQAEVKPLILALELLVSGVIAFEYSGRLFLATNKVEYLLNPLSILDLISIVPAFQPFRLLRFIVLGARFLRMTYRYRFFLKTVPSILRSVSFELYALFLPFVFLILTAVVVIYSLETSAGNSTIKSLFDALYLAVITMTTVGYGDVLPITREGKFLAMLLGIGGLILLSMSISTLSAGFFSYVQMLKMGMISFKDMKDHIVVCGWNETAKVVIDDLKGLDRDIVLLTTQDIPPLDGIYYKKGDFGREEVLADAGVDKAYMVLVLGEKLPGFSEDSVDARTILTGMQVRDMNRDAILILELLLGENAKLIRRRRIADYIIVGGEVLGTLISRIAQHKFYGEFLDHLVEHVDLEIREWEEEVSVGEAERRIEHEGYRIVGVLRDGRATYFPRASYTLKKGDKLLLVRERKRKEGSS